MLTLDELLADLLYQATDQTFTSERPDGTVGHECDGCGIDAPDVDLWAEDPETGEQLWLCGACGC